MQRAEGVVPLPEQMAADIELEFGVKFGKAHTERGPVLGRKDREEAVNRADVSTRKGVRVYQGDERVRQSNRVEQPKSRKRTTVGILEDVQQSAIEIAKEVAKKL